MTVAELNATRRLLPVDDPTVGLTDEEARALQLLRRLEYVHPWHQIGGAYLRRVIAREQIPVLDPTAVREYQEAVLARERTKWIEETLPTLRIGDDCYRWMYRPEPTWNEEETRIMLADQAEHRFRFMRNHVNALRTIPDAALDLALQVMDAVADEAPVDVFVESLDDDPFLCVAVGETKFYLAVWDEPGFRERGGELLF